MRVILYTDKGGVGKTSLAAATAVRCAEKGCSTLVISTDSAHSLGDALGTDLGGDPHEVGANLWAQELDAHALLRTYWGGIQGYLGELLRSQGLGDIQAEELTILPGLEELLYLLRITETAREGAYEVIILDCAPTGSTLKLLSFPEVFHWYMDKFFPIERKIVRVMRPVTRHIGRFPLPDDGVFDSVEQLYRRVGQAKTLLTDPKITSVRLVLNPEKMVIKESQRAFALLNLFGFTVDAVVMNRVFGNDLGGSSLKKWPAIHRRHLLEAHRVFDPLPILSSRFYEEEIVGLPRLSAMGRHVFGPRDPSKFFLQRPPVEISKKNAGYTLSVRMPGIKKEELGLWVRDHEVIVQVKNYQRNILLPQALSSMKVVKAQKKKDLLEITFGDAKEAKAD